MEASVAGGGSELSFIGGDGSVGRSSDSRSVAEGGVLAAGVTGATSTGSTYGCLS